MAEANDISLFRLARFDREYLRPKAESHVGFVPATPQRNYYLAELMEGYFWLALGVALEVFRGDEARLLVRHRFAPAFYEFRELFDSWGYLLDQELMILVENAISQGQFFTKTGLTEFEHPERLTASFQSMELLHTRFSASDSVQQFLTFLNFQPQRMLSLLERSAFLSEQILIESGFLGGFLRSLEYMGDCRLFFIDLRKNEYVEERCACPAR